MLGSQASQVLLTVVIILVLLNELRVSNVRGASCRQVHMRPPRMGQRCITDTEVYRNHSAIPQGLCMWHCLRNTSCTVINYNMLDSYCLLGQGSCVSLEPEADFITIPLTMQEPCLTWIRQDTMPPPLQEISNLVLYPVIPGNTMNNIIVARAILNSTKIPGKFQNSYGQFSLNGQVEIFSAGNYEILIVSPRCNLSWVNYDSGSGNVLPGGAVVGGYQNGLPLYVARKGNNYLGHSYRYAAGYYDTAGEGEVSYGTRIFKFTEMEILVANGWI